MREKNLLIAQVIRLPWWLSSKASTCTAGVQKTQVQSLGLEDPLEKEMATHFSILAWRIPWTEKLRRLSPCGRKESDTTEVT